MHQVSPGHWASLLMASTSLAIGSFGEDESGELYGVDLNGGVYKIVLVNPYRVYLPLVLRSR